MSQPGAVAGAILEWHAARAAAGVSPGVNAPSITTPWDDLGSGGTDGALTGFAGTEASGWATDPYRLVFDGVNDIVQLANTGLLDMGTADRSIEVWCSLPVLTGNDGNLIGKGSSSDAGAWGFRFIPTLGVRAFFTESYANRQFSPDFNTAADAMHHYVATYDRDGLMRFYVDGVQQGAGTNISAYAAANMTNTTKVALANFGAAYMQCEIPIVRVYSRVLTPAEVAQNTAAGTSWLDVATTAVSAIFSDSAASGGTVGVGGEDATVRGVCWNTSGSPTPADAKTTDGSGAGTFTSVLTGLENNVRYYFRAYAVNPAGTAYGEEFTFKAAGPRPASKRVATPPSLLVGSAALGWTNLPLAVEKRWKHGQHGPADASFRVPCRPFGALDPRLRRDQRLFVSVGARCVWSGYLLPVSSAQSDGSLLTIEAAGTFERGKHDESYVRTFTDSDESKFYLRKGSSQRFTIESEGTLVLRAEGGGGTGADGEATNWRAALWAELVYWLDDGLGDPGDVISALDFVWNCDMTTSWVTYIDAYTDPAAVSPISRIWSKNETGSGRETALACPANCQAVAFGMRVVTKNQLATDVFAELSDVYVTASRPTSLYNAPLRIDEALAAAAEDLTDGAITTTAIGTDLEHLVWPLGSGSRSYAQESIASLHSAKTDWRYVSPDFAPGDDSFVAGEMPTTPPNRQRWWFVSAKDPGVTVDLTYQDPEGMDIAAVLYSLKGNSRMLVPVPNPETVSVFPAGFDYSANVSVTNVAYGAWGFTPIGFLLTSDATFYNPRVGYVGGSGYGAPVVPGAEYTATADVLRCTTFWPTPDYTPYIALQVLWFNAGHGYISTSVVDTAAGYNGESGHDLPAQGSLITMGVGHASNPVVAPAGAAFGKVEVTWVDATGGSGQVAVSNCHLDSLVVPGSKLSVAYHPAAPTSIDQRVRVFDYSSEALTDAAADNVLHHAYAWYGVEESERDREPVGTIGVLHTIKNIDGGSSPVGVIQTGDWITVVDDVDHVTWPQPIVGVEIGDDGESASIELGGDGGDFNYTGRADTPALQKRKRRKGHHRRKPWHPWAMKRARAEYAKYRKSSKNPQWKTFVAYMKAHPLPKKHPKWAPG